MARADYNNIMSVYAGMGTATPGAFLRTQVCHLVEEHVLQELAPPILGHHYYVNYDTPILAAGSTVTLLGQIRWNYRLADFVEIPAGSGITYQVLRSARILVASGTQPVYFRSYLAPGPY